MVVARVHTIVSYSPPRSKLTVHSVQALAGAQYAQYEHSMRLDAGTTCAAQHSCPIETIALTPATVGTLAHAASAMSRGTGRNRANPIAQTRTENSGGGVADPHVGERVAGP